MLKKVCQLLCEKEAAFRKKLFPPPHITKVCYNATHTVSNYDQNSIYKIQRQYNEQTELQHFETLAIMKDASFKNARRSSD